MDNIFEKFKLNEQVAIVTGGIGLLGSQFCWTLAQAGARIVVADLDESKAIDQANNIQSAGFLAKGMGVDVTSYELVNSMVVQVLEAWGSVDILVCSAAMDPKFNSSQTGKHANTFENFPLQAWKDALDGKFNWFVSLRPGCIRTYVETGTRSYHQHLFNLWPGWPRSKDL